MVSIIIWVPAACIGTGFYLAEDVFYSLLEEIIGWVGCVGSKQSIDRVYLRRRLHPSPFNPSEMQLLFSGFETFIESIRQPQVSFPGPGRIRVSYGDIEIRQAVNLDGEVMEDYAVRLTLDNGRGMTLHLPRGVTELPKDWILDWLKIQNEFTIRII